MNGMATPSGAQTGSPLRVKFTAKGHRWRDRLAFLRQFPGSQPRWGNCLFDFDPESRDYDWLVCYDDLAPAAAERFSSRVETLACPPEHTLLITMEPSSVKIYGRDFLGQFGHVLTSQEPWAIGTPNAIYSQPALRWFYGIGGAAPRDWDTLVASPPSDKTRDLSTVCSNKRQTKTLHATRFAFTHQLAERLPELRIFGHGTEPIADKAEAIDPFRYHLVIENHLAPHHWTEKLADTFLGMALPLYVGCPNAADYFPEESFIPLRWDDVEAAAKTIRRAIRDGEYQRRLPAIIEARRRVLHQYNLFAVVAQLVEAHHNPARRRQPAARLYSRHAIRRRNWLSAARYAWEKTRQRGRIRKRVDQMKPPRAA
jgi:hypothetical protein